VIHAWRNRCHFPFNKSSDVGITHTHKGNLSVRNLRTSFAFMRSAYDVYLDNEYLYTGRSYCVWKDVIFVCPVLFCPLLVIYRLSFIPLNLQRLFRLFSRVLNATSRRLGWRHRVFVCLLRLSLWNNTANTSPITRSLLPLHALCTIHLNLPAPITLFTELGCSIVITWVISLNVLRHSER